MAGHCKYSHGDLMVYWSPRAFQKSFSMTVKSPVEAKLVLKALEKYDDYQRNNAINTGDCIGVGGLLVFVEHDKCDSINGSWYDWATKDGNGIDDFTLAKLRESTPKWQLEET